MQPTGRLRLPEPISTTHAAHAICAWPETGWRLDIPMSKAKRTREQQTYVAQALASFDALSVVAAVLKRDFGIVFSPQAAWIYDRIAAASGSVQILPRPRSNPQRSRGDRCSLRLREGCQR
ncbi:DUF2280 domain-containing protein [Rhizobium sp. B230/85]|uniref:DUF2280 domain-containing protein n=2 Tax=unclassified Rhizobium TaxID=2613769 RepID=UPI0027DBF7F6|nr:DUF2280 domain-containing protein [Rhizobium sp. B230/85]